MGISCFSAPIHKQTSVNVQSSIDIKHYISLKHELTEYKIRCKELEMRNKELNQQLNQFVSPHHNWNHKQICEWTIELDDGIFLPYKHNLLTNLKTEDITGKDLCQLDINDLHRLGITLSAHRYLLMAHIKTLTKNDSTPQYYDQFDQYLPHAIKTPTTNSCQMDFDDIIIGSTDPSHTNDKASTLALLSHKWNYNNGILFIKVIKGININLDNECLYLEIELRGDYYQKETTKKICNCTNPIYNEKFQFFSDNPKKDILNVRIWSKKKWSLDENIGILSIPVMDILKCDGYMDKQYDIDNSKYGGKLHLQLKYKELLH